MANKSQPKIPELVESLLKEMEVFKDGMCERSKSLENSISKINNIKVEFDLDRFEEIQKSNLKDLANSRRDFDSMFKKSHENLLRRIKSSHSTICYYFILLNSILIIALGLALYSLEIKSDQIEKSLTEKSNSI